MSAPKAKKTLPMFSDADASLEPKNARGYLARAHANVALNNDDDALKDLDDAIRLDSKLKIAWNSRGNIYVRNCAMIGETAEMARAARRNGGCVIANVGLVVDEGYDRVYLPADMVDAIVYHPDTEQAAGYRRHRAQCREIPGLVGPGERHGDEHRVGRDGKDRAFRK